jgi:hypothetical protein
MPAATLQQFRRVCRLAVREMGYSLGVLFQIEILCLSQALEASILVNLKSPRTNRSPRYIKRESHHVHD